ncbi:hypothetical protein [Gordonia sp. DT101]|uniref:hypothetical protein n=1 Tax=Gordonia sp. DT101 TaxID=3416545 RepID=UPI003CF186F6
MDLFDVTRIALRRWWVTLPIVLITFVIAYNNYSGVKIEYYSSATIGITTPSVEVVAGSRPDGSTVQSRNGLEESGGPSMLANLLDTALLQPQVGDKVRAGGGTAPVTITVKSSDSGSQLPIIEISAAGEDADAVARSVALTVAASNEALRSLQEAAGVPPDQMAKTFVVAQPSQPVGAIPARTRELIATVVAGILIAALAAVIVNAIIEFIGRRRSRRADRDEPSSGEAPDEQPSTPEHTVSSHR